MFDISFSTSTDYTFNNCILTVGDINSNVYCHYQLASY